MNRPDSLAADKRTAVVDGVTLHLAHPDVLPMEWVGRAELKTQVLAAWRTVASQDLPLTPRRVGKPGVGKTTLA